MQISVDAALINTIRLSDEGNGPVYDLPRRLVLAIQGAEEAQAEAIQHLRDTGQVQPGDVIDTNWPAP